jgi:membrane protein DedA with SNARE-associated domain
VFVILMLEMIGIPFPAETTLTAAGLGLSNGTFTFIPLFLTAVLGNVAGSSIAYWLGQRLGRTVILKIGKYVGITEQRLGKAEDKLLKYRIPVFLLSKFIAGVRVFVPYLAGINKMPFKMFLAYNTLAAIIWVTFFIFLGRWIHVAWSKYHTYLHGGLLISIIGVLVAALIIKIVLKNQKKQIR